MLWELRAGKQGQGLASLQAAPWWHQPSLRSVPLCFPSGNIFHDGRGFLRLASLPDLHVLPSLVSGCVEAAGRSLAAASISKRG